MRAGSWHSTECEEPIKGRYDKVEQPDEGGLNIYADFNNASPHYSHHAFGLGNNKARFIEVPVVVCPAQLTFT